MKVSELKMRLIVPVFLLCCFVFFGNQSAHATCTPVNGGLVGVSASNTNTVLMLATTLTEAGNPAGNLCNSLEAVQAQNAPLSLDVEIDDAVAWGLKSTAQFASYRAIVLGDPDCVTGTGPITAAQNNAATWGAAITGRVAIVGTDPEYHSLSIHNSPPQTTTATQLTENAIAYATSLSGQPGAYISLSCYYANSAPNASVPVLAPFGSFTVEGQFTLESSTNNSHIVGPTNPLATTPNTLTDAGLSNWIESTHEAFNSFPSNFTAVVQSVDLGLPYILTGETQTQTLGPPGTTTTFTFNTDTYKITGVTNAGGEIVTVKAVPVPQSSVPVGSISLFPKETCVPYADYTAAAGGVPTCVEFQATCTGTDCGSNGTFVYKLTTGFDLAPAQIEAGGIGAPDFLAFHGDTCPPPAGRVPESIFFSYNQFERDPVLKGGGKDLTCFFATYDPFATPVTSASVGSFFVGFQPPIKNPPFVNPWEEFFWGDFIPIPLIWQEFDTNGQLIEDRHFFSFCSPDTPLANCPANSVALQFVPIDCTTLAATGGAVTRANALFNSVFFFNDTFIVFALPRRSLDDTCQAVQLVITGSSGAQSTHTAFFHFK